MPYAIIGVIYGIKARRKYVNAFKKREILLVTVIRRYYVKRNLFKVGKNSI